MLPAPTGPSAAAVRRGGSSEGGPNRGRDPARRHHCSVAGVRGSGSDPDVGEEGGVRAQAHSAGRAHSMCRQSGSERKKTGGG